jgi:CRISPR-associated protein Cmr5
MQAITEEDQRHYIRAQTEALAYLVWLKKFANAYLERGELE